MNNVDWSRFAPAVARADVAAGKLEAARVLHESVARGEQINIHFHVFEPANVLALLNALRGWTKTHFNWEVVDCAERFPSDNPNGFLAVVRVNKSWHDHIEGAWHRLQTRRDPCHALQPGAEPFADFLKNSPGDRRIH